MLFLFYMFMKNFIYIEDNFFDKKTCQNIIEKYKNNVLKGETHTGYDYFFLKHYHVNLVLQENIFAICDLFSICNIAALLV